jgi:UDP-N-acetylmuramoyl-L-alanyl-D-glutamate--2,6-diaminopimelate ligase
VTCTAIFTNLTQDHLDYHQTMENYKMAKGLLFARMGNTLNQQKFAILNKDDPASEYYRKLTSAQVITYGIDNDADITASDIHITSQGIDFTVSTSTGKSKFSLNLLGKFNVYNALAAIAATWVEGISLEKIGHSLKQLKGIEGRMEVVDEGQDFLVAVDYAHSPDGLENALNTIRQFATRKIYCVFGCGGDRDRGKRPLMGQKQLI